MKQQQRYRRPTRVPRLAACSASWMACCLALPVQAADENPFFSELPIVASVSRLPQQLADAPTSVTVIDRAMIKASGARDLNDLFRLVPGFQTFPNNTDTSRVAYHGLNDQNYSPRVQVLIDGRSQYSPLFRNGVNWATLPVALEDIERIEVVRGSNAASYGSNAFLGVVNIITVDPALARGFSISGNRGNQGVRDYTLRSGGKLGEAADFRFTYQQKDDDGLTNQYDWVDSFRSRLFDLRADFTLSDHDMLQFSAGHVEAVTQRGRLPTSGDMVVSGVRTDWPLHDFSQSDSYLQLLWRRSLSADSDVQLRYSYVADWASDRYVISEYGLLANLDEYGDDGIRHEVEMQHNFAPFAHTRVVWGAGWRRDEVRSDTVFAGLGSVYRNVERLFANVEWKPLRLLTGNLGVSTERDSLAGTHTSPRASISVHLTPENTIRVGYSQAYRTGSTADYRGYEVVHPFALANGTPVPASTFSAYLYKGNPNLPAERMDTWELGYLGDWKAQRMSLDVRLFQEKLPNRLLEVSPKPGDLTDYSKATYMAPGQRVRTEGIEYQWKWQPVEATKLTVSQSFIRIYADFLAAALNGPLQGYAADDLSNLQHWTDKSAPSHTTSILLMQKLPFGIDASLAGYWLDKMKWTRNTEVNGYHRIDGRLGYPFRWGSRGGEIAYTVQSLNGAHGEFSSYGQPADRVVDRRQWVSLRLDF